MTSPSTPPKEDDHPKVTSNQTGAYLSTMYESMTSTAQSAYGQLPSLDPLRALLPGHSTATTGEDSLINKSQTDQKEIGSGIVSSSPSLQAANTTDQSKLRGQQVKVFNLMTSYLLSPTPSTLSNRQ